MIKSILFVMFFTGFVLMPFALRGENGESSALQNTPVYYPEKGVQQLLIGLKLNAVPAKGLPTHLAFTLSGETAASSVKNFTLWTSFDKPYWDPTQAKRIEGGTFSLQKKTIVYTRSGAGPVQVGAGDYLWLTAEVNPQIKANAVIDAGCTRFVFNETAMTVNNPNPPGKGRIPVFKRRIVPYFRLNWMPREDGGLGYGNWNERCFKHITDLIFFQIACNPGGRLLPLEKGFDDAVKRLKKDRRKINLNARILVGMAGCSDAMKSVCADPEKRKQLIGELKNLIQKQGFDGIDIDWEYPQNALQWSQFSLFVAELKIALFPLGATVSAAVNAQYCAPPTHLVHQLDFVNLMSYDSHPGEHSNYARFTGDVAWALNRMKLPRSKIVPGLPFYGMILAEKAPDGSRCWDTQRGYSFIFNLDPSRAPDDDFYTDPKYGRAYFNNSETLRKKCKYALKEKLGGVMIWAYDTDLDITHAKALGKVVSDAFPR